jgi:hypothetical protein
MIMRSTMMLLLYLFAFSVCILFGEQIGSDLLSPMQPNYRNNPESLSERPVYLSEGFESAFPPSGWQTTLSPSWTATNNASYVITPTFSAFFRSQGDTNGRKLITPKVRITSGATLSFKAMRGPSVRNERLLVRYSSDNVYWNDLVWIDLTNPASIYTIPLGTISEGDYYLCWETHSTNMNAENKTYILDDVSGPPLTSSVQFGNITGYVFQAGTSNPISGAELSLNGNTSFSNSSGYYSFENQTSGQHVLFCSATGYNDTALPVTIVTDNTVIYNVQITSIGYQPQIPNNLTISRVTGGFELHWSASLFAQSYHVYASGNPNSGFNDIMQVSINQAFLSDSYLIQHGCNPTRSMFKVTADGVLML